MTTETETVANAPLSHLFKQAIAIVQNVDEYTKLHSILRSGRYDIKPPGYFHECDRYDKKIIDNFIYTGESLNPALDVNLSGAPLYLILYSIQTRLRKIIEHISPDSYFKMNRIEKLQKDVEEEFMKEQALGMKSSLSSSSSITEPIVSKPQVKIQKNDIFVSIKYCDNDMINTEIVLKSLIDSEIFSYNLCATSVHSNGDLVFEQIYFKKNASFPVDTFKYYSKGSIVSIFILEPLIKSKNVIAKDCATSTDDNGNFVYEKIYFSINAIASIPNNCIINDC